MKLQNYTQGCSNSCILNQGGGVCFYIRYDLGLLSMFLKLYRKKHIELCVVQINNILYYTYSYNVYLQFTHREIQQVFKFIRLTFKISI
jgi:hypothetical protein